MKVESKTGSGNAWEGVRRATSGGRARGGRRHGALTGYARLCPLQCLAYCVCTVWAISMLLHRAMFREGEMASRRKCGVETEKHHGFPVLCALYTEASTTQSYNG